MITTVPSVFSEVKISTPMIIEGVVETGSGTSTQTSAEEIKPGTIIVESPSTTKTTVHGLSSDGKIRVEITVTVTFYSYYIIRSADSQTR